MPFTNEELIERKNYLGGSESAASLGMSDWYTQLQLYRSKTEGVDPIEETLPMMVGIALEPTVLRLLEKETGMTVKSRQAVINDPVLPWRRATIDGITDDGFLVEAKTSGQWSNWGAKEDEVPQSYIYQVHHSFACDPSLKGAWIPVILAQREFRIYRVDRDEELIQLLTAGETEFWNRVINKDPPPPRTAEDIKYLYPTDVGTKISATTEIEKLALKLADTKEKRKALEKLEIEESLKIKDFMKMAAILVDSRGDPLFTYKGSTRSSIDVKLLREKEPDVAARYMRESVVRSLLCKV